MINTFVNLFWKGDIQISFYLPYFLKYTIGPYNSKQKFRQINLVHFFLFPVKLIIHWTDLVECEEFDVDMGRQKDGSPGGLV